eukprot:998448-Lingulodinium_polyedra.AAC.1
MSHNSRCLWAYRTTSCTPADGMELHTLGCARTFGSDALCVFLFLCCSCACDVRVLRAGFPGVRSWSLRAL